MTFTLKNVDPWTAAANVTLSDTDYDVPREATLQMVAMIRLVLLQCPNVHARHQVSCHLVSPRIVRNEGDQAATVVTVDLQALNFGHQTSTELQLLNFVVVRLHIQATCCSHNDITYQA